VKGHRGANEEWPLVKRVGTMNGDSLTLYGPHAVVDGKASNADACRI